MSNRIVAAIAAEISEEKAGSLGRAGAALENALRELRSFDPPADAPAHVRAERRARLLGHAARAALSFIVQREACGLRDHEYVYEQYEVPKEVVVRIGRRVPPA